MTATERLLPAEFAALEPFVEKWALPTMGQRHRRRVTSDAREREAFYQAGAPELERIIDYLRPFPLDDMPPDATRLLQLSLSLVEVSMTQEVYTPDFERRHAKASSQITILHELDGL